MVALTGTVSRKMLFKNMGRRSLQVRNPCSDETTIASSVLNDLYHDALLRSV